VSRERRERFVAVSGSESLVRVGAVEPPPYDYRGLTPGSCHGHQTLHHSVPRLVAGWRLRAAPSDKVHVNGLDGR
jgi:hypothetical protein